MASPTASSGDVTLRNERRSGFLGGPRQSENALELLEEVDATHPAHPIFWSEWKKWWIIIVYNILQIFVGWNMTAYVSAEYLIQEKWHVSPQVATLGQSMFIVGNAIGPAFLGPLSDIGGRKWVYIGSTFLYAIFNIGAAAARNFPMLVIFQFLCGAVGSAALANVAGTTADLWEDSDGAGQGMALFVAAANIGPSVGSIFGNLIAKNHHMGWRWIFWLNTIIGGGFSIALAFIPETLPRVVIARAIKKSGTEDPKYKELAEAKVDIWSEMYFVTTMTFKILLTEPIVDCLAVYNGWAFGLIFLYLDGVFPVFVENEHLSVVNALLTYLNIAVGVIVMFCLFPIQTWFYVRDRKNNGGKGRPEARFLTSLVVIWLFPGSLFWFAFTSNGQTDFWVPIVAGGVLGFCDSLLLCAMLSYITDSYPNVAASAVAAFLVPTFLLAAGFAHLGITMFNNLGTTWASACVAFLSLGCVGLVYIVYFFGPALRRRSKLASKE